MVSERDWEDPGLKRFKLEYEKTSWIRCILQLIDIGMRDRLLGSWSGCSWTEMLSATDVFDLQGGRMCASTLRGIAYSTRQSLEKMQKNDYAKRKHSDVDDL